MFHGTVWFTLGLMIDEAEFNWLAGQDEQVMLGC